MRIYSLSPYVANQIAAGEVIERPASVVKELLENALDAGATQIGVEVRGGGLNLIKISDNGFGIVAEDLPLAIAAHATSKITQLDDLYQIQSMGFRGEALASIAAVSKLSVLSKPAIQPHAMMLIKTTEGCQITPAARTQGTTIEVRDLFYNTPVRKKFLKSEAIEYRMLEAVVKRFVLSAPHIGLTFKHNDRLILRVPGAMTEALHLARIKKIFGKAFVEQSIYIESECGTMRLMGWVSGVNYQRSQSDKQWIYLNNRMVKDKLLLNALKQAYEKHLYPGRYPACALYLTLPPIDVDVNVHPTKHEVRFQQPRLVHDFISSQVRQALVSSEALETKSQSLTDEHETFPFIKRSKASQMNEAWSEHETFITSSEPRSLLSLKESAPFPYEPFISIKGLPIIPLNREFALIFIHHPPYLVDIPVVYQRCLLTKLEAQTLPLKSRPLLVPLKFTLEEKERDHIEHYIPILLEYGLQIDFVSAHQVIIRTIPLCLPHLDLSLLWKNVLQASFESLQILQRMVACHRVQVADLNLNEQEELIIYLQGLSHKELMHSGCRSLNEQHCRELVYG